MTIERLCKCGHPTRGAEQSLCRFCHSMWMFRSRHYQRKAQKMLGSIGVSRYNASHKQTASKRINAASGSNQTLKGTQSYG